MESFKSFFHKRLGKAHVEVLWPVWMEELNALGASSDKRVYFARQSHTCNVLSWLNTGALSKSKSTFWDGAFWSDPQIAVGVRTSDCMPIGIYSETPEMFGIIHLSWINAQNGMLDAFFDRFLHQMDQKLLKIHVWVGPHICGNHLWLDERTVRHWLKQNGEEDQSYFVLEDNRFLFRWETWLTDKLQRKGLVLKSIEFCHWCTLCVPTFPSFRRLGTPRPFVLTLMSSSRSVLLPKTAWKEFVDVPFYNPVQMNCFRKSDF